MTKASPTALYQSLGDAYSVLHDLVTHWFAKPNLNGSWRHSRHYLEKVTARIFDATNRPVDHQTVVVYLVFSTVLAFITIISYFREARVVPSPSETSLECEKGQAPTSILDRSIRTDTSDSVTLDEDQNALVVDEVRVSPSPANLEDSGAPYECPAPMNVVLEASCSCQPNADDISPTVVDTDVTQVVLDLPSSAADIPVFIAASPPVSPQALVALESERPLCATSTKNKTSDKASLPAACSPANQECVGQGRPTEEASHRLTSLARPSRDVCTQIPTDKVVNGAEPTTPSTPLCESTAEPSIIQVPPKPMPIKRISNSEHAQTSVFIRSYEIIDLTDPKPEEEPATADQTNFKIQLVEGPAVGLRSRTRTHTAERPDWALAPDEDPSQQSFGPMTRSKTRRGIKARRGRKSPTPGVAESSGAKEEPTRIMEVNGKWARGTGRSKGRGRGRA